MNTIIKQATIADAQLLTDLGARAFLEAYIDVNELNDLNDYIKTAFIKEQIEASIKSNEAIFFIAYIADEAVGYVKLRWDGSHPNLSTEDKNMQLERIYVLRDYWRHKVGATMMLEAIQIAKSKTYDYLWLGVWQQNNRAIDFYLKMGFEIFGTKKFYVGTKEHDDFVLRIKL